VKLLIISGLSGSGKSIALQALEDSGFYCVDNLPAGLLPTFAMQLYGLPESHRYEEAAVGIDARNLSDDLDQFPKVLEDIRGLGYVTEIIFLQADDNTLIKRFSETRRRHPLTAPDLPLADAISRERRLLAPLSACADLRIDTSHLNVHQLREVIRERVAGRSAAALSLLFVSFGYKDGIPADADFVFDVRCLPNPHWEPRLRPLTGLDEPVAEFLGNQPQAVRLVAELIAFLEEWIPHFEAENRSYLTVAVGCTGGRHRSTFMVEQLAAHFRGRGLEVMQRHRELA